MLTGGFTITGCGSSRRSYSRNFSHEFQSTPCNSAEWRFRLPVRVSGVFPEIIEERAKKIFDPRNDIT